MTGSERRTYEGGRRELPGSNAFNREMYWMMIAQSARDIKDERSLRMAYQYISHLKK